MSTCCGDGAALAANVAARKANDVSVRGRRIGFAKVSAPETPAPRLQIYHAHEAEIHHKSVGLTGRPKDLFMLGNTERIDPPRDRPEPVEEFSRAE
jgi:hypothetical protein